MVGEKAQRKVGACSVLIVGLNGLGVEVAKNVILAGVQRVTLLDSTPTSTWDLGAQFFLREGDVGKPRAAACASGLQELNGYVTVGVEEGTLTAELVAGHDIVIMVDGHKDTLLAANAWAREGKVRERFGVVVCQWRRTPAAPRCLAEQVHCGGGHGHAHVRV